MNRDADDLHSMAEDQEKLSKNRSGVDADTMRELQKVDE